MLLARGRASHLVPHVGLLILLSGLCSCATSPERPPVESTRATGPSLQLADVPNPLYEDLTPVSRGEASAQLGGPSGTELRPAALLERGSRSDALVEVRPTSDHARGAGQEVVALHRHGGDPTGEATPWAGPSRTGVSGVGVSGVGAPSSQGGASDASLYPGAGPEAMGEDPALAALEARLLRELARFRERDERTLDDAERLTKHNLEVRLMALVFARGVTAPATLERLLAAIQEPHTPGSVHSLLRAALYHHVGSETRRDAVLRALAAGPTHNPFSIQTLELCLEIGDGGQRTRHQEYRFAPDQELHVYGELINLTALRSGSDFASQVRVQVFLLDQQRVVDHRDLGEMTGRQATPSASDFFALIYRLPLMVKPGPYVLRVLATDLNAPGRSVAQHEVPISIER